jgi:hypothetical protein
MNPNNLVREIHIGNIINYVIDEKGLSINELRSRIGVSTRMINQMLSSASIDTQSLLKWSKVLKYDFFRLYSSHLMLHHGISNTLTKKTENIEVEGIHIRKNVYTKELIQFIVNKVRNKEMTTRQVISQYGIPKTTFYKWLQKYPKD